MKKFGFTLAEVLITLGIIGIVASLTIPTLMQNTQNTQFVAGFKKAFSLWGQTVIKMADDEGSPGNLGSFFESTDAQVMGPKIAKYFKVVKTCATGQTGCFAPTSYMNYDHTAPTDTLGTTSDYNNYQFVTSDGMSFGISYPAANCNNNLTGVAGTNMKATCMELFLDVNGIKPPNTAGRDLFRAFITNGKGPIIYPYAGTEYNHWTDHYCNKGVGAGVSTFGFGCSARIIEEGWQMNY